MSRFIKNGIYDLNIQSENIQSENIQSENIQSENNHKIYSILESSKYYNNEEAENSKYNKLDRSDNLPKGWIKLFDENTQKYYYACTITKHTQWLNPSIPIGKIMPNGLPY